MKQKNILNLMKKFQAVDVSEFQKRVSEEYPEIADNTLYGGKFAGSDAEHKGAEYIANELKGMGIENVEILPFQACRYQFNDATMTLKDSVSKTVTVKPGPYVSPGTNGSVLKGEIVEVAPYMPEGFEMTETKGKIVFVEVNVDIGGGTHSFAVAEAEKRGALAVVILQVGNNLDETTLKTQVMSFAAKIPVVGITPGDAAILRDMLATGTVAAELTVDSEIDRNGVSHGVIGEIVGEIPDEWIVFSGHYDHYFKCMQDDISSVVGMLGIAKKMVESGYRPNRSIAFMFNGAHEFGGIEGTNPYITGSYVILDEVKKEWIKNIVLDINFEYMALKQKQLRSMASYEVIDLYKGFLEYMGDQQSGFEEVAKDIRMEDYIYASWADMVSFVSKGAPIISNDAFTEQYLKNESPYIGRDHSTSDNWDVYDLEVLNTTTNWYGSLGIYAAQRTVPEYNFANRVQAFKLNSEEQASIEACGIDVSALTNIVDEIEEAGVKLYEKIVKANDCGMYAASEKASKEIREIMYHFSGATDWFSGTGFITIGHKIHLNTIGILNYAKDLLKSKEIEKAINEGLLFIDYASVPYMFGKEAADRIETLLQDECLLRWSRRKRTNALLLTDLMLALKEKITAGINDYSAEIELIDAYIQAETMALTDTLKREEAQLIEVLEMIKSCITLF